MIPSVQSAAPTNPILPMQSADAPKSGNFKLALDQAADIEEPATSKDGAVQANDVKTPGTPEDEAVQSGDVKAMLKGEAVRLNGFKVPKSTGEAFQTSDIKTQVADELKSINQNQHGKSKDDKQDQGDSDAGTVEPTSPLQILAVPVAQPVNAIQIVSMPEAVSPAMREPHTALDVDAADTISTQLKSPQTAPQTSSEVLEGKDTAAGKKAPSFFDGLSLPVNESLKAAPAAVDAGDPAKTKSTVPVAGEKKADGKIDNKTDSKTGAVRGPVESASKPVETFPISAEIADAALPAALKATPAPGIPETLRHIPMAAAPAVAQAVQPEASQPSKTPKARTVQNDGQSSAVLSQTQQSGVQQVATAQADNKSDTSSAKSFAEKGAGEASKSETRKAEVGFDSQAGALAAARQTVSREPANTVQGASHSQASAPGATVPAARQFQSTPNISSAHLVQTMNGSEMRVGLHSAEFGNIAIHTAIENGNVSANISVEHSSLGKAVADQLPALASKLHDEQGIHTQINIQDQSAGFSGEARQQQSQEYQQSPTPNAVKMPFQVERATNTTSVPTTAAATTNGRLSIRI